MSDQLEEGELSEVIEDDVALSDSDEEWRLRGSLPVAPMDNSFDPNAEPVSGEEYLRLVRYGAWQLPFAIRAEEKQIALVAPLESDPIDELDKQLNADTPPTPTHLFPAKDFVDTFMKSFLEGCALPQDEHLYETDADGKYPPSSHEGDWRALLYPEEDGRKARERVNGLVGEGGGAGRASCDLSSEKILTLPAHNEGERSPKRARGHSIEPEDLYRAPPSQRQLMQLVKYHRKWVASSEPRTVTLRQYQFIVRILQALDARVTPWQISCLRDLAVLMIRIRREMAPANGAEGCDNHNVLFYTNGIIVAIAKRFGQADLLTK